MRLFVLLGVVVVVALGCAREDPGTEQASNEIPLEDVAPPVDAAIDVDADPKAIARGGESLGGVLPSDFPETFTLPRPASIIDLAEEGDEAVVVLRTPSTPGAVASFFAKELPRGGWSEEGGVWRREGRQVRVLLATSPDGCRVTLRYR